MKPDIIHFIIREKLAAVLKWPGSSVWKCETVICIRVSGGCQWHDWSPVIQTNVRRCPDVSRRWPTLAYRSAMMQPNTIYFVFCDHLHALHYYTFPATQAMSDIDEWTLKVTYHSIYSMNKFVTNISNCYKMGHKCFLIWGDWLSCDPLRGSHDSQSPHIRT